MSHSLLDSRPPEEATEEKPSKALLGRHLRKIDPKAVKNKSWRIRATVLDPMLFALIYLPHHLKNDQGNITISYVHDDWCEQARRWVATSAAAREMPTDIEIDPIIDKRHAYVAPRDLGKSTWWFLILPMWAAAHGHKKFAAAFADSGTQAEIHLTTFKNELDQNKMLRGDFPTLCAPAKREATGQAISDSRALIAMRNGFAFAARGIDASNLGLKMDANRPDLLIFDDIEPSEANYSEYQMQKRLSTVIEAVLPMNLAAHVVFAGTVTMPGSIIHQLVKSVEARTEPEEWIEEQKVNVHYYPPVTVAPDGTESSIWPEKWSIRYLRSISHTRTYAKNFKNMPIARSGEYWTEQDFVINGDLEGITSAIIQIDPATTKKRTSDYTGIATVGLRPGFKPRKGSTIPARLPKAVVIDAVQVKLTGEKLRARVLRAIEQSPIPIRVVRVEVNQGGEHWYSILHDMPVPLKIDTESVAKEVRAANCLGHYQRGHVEHAKHIPQLEEQMTNYPDVLHDDLIDCVGAAISYYARKRRRVAAFGGSSRSYV